MTAHIIEYIITIWVWNLMARPPQAMDIMGYILPVTMYQPSEMI